MEGGLVERDKREGERNRRSGCMLTFPYLSPNGGWNSYKGRSQLLFSLRIKATFTRSVISCVPASCVGNFPLLPRHPQQKVIVGW